MELAAIHADGTISYHFAETCDIAVSQAQDMVTTDNCSVIVSFRPMTDAEIYTVVNTCWECGALNADCKCYTVFCPTCGVAGECNNLPCLIADDKRHTEPVDCIHKEGHTCPDCNAPLAACGGVLCQTDDVAPACSMCGVITANGASLCQQHANDTGRCGFCGHIIDNPNNNCWACGHDVYRIDPDMSIADQVDTVCVHCNQETCTPCIKCDAEYCIDCKGCWDNTVFHCMFCHAEMNGDYCNNCGF